MTSFRTELSPTPSSWQIHHGQQLLALGSCFAENIGAQLQAHKFRVELNPFGIVYNPLSLAASLERLLNPQPYQTTDLVQNAGLWHNFDHHGVFSHPDREQGLQNINQRLAEATQALDRADVLLITLGTAYVFEHLASQKVVANCHKFPGQDFRRYRLEVGAVYEGLAGVLKKLLERKPHLRIIITVSPVRHLRDGLHENQLSKACLLLATEQLSQQFEQAEYYPAYELQLDDLRDYRFYAEDLAHPNQQAVDYIWSHFGTTYFIEPTRQLNREITKVNRALQHRPFHPGSSEHQVFVRKQLEKIEVLEGDYPGLDFAAERKFFTAQIV